MTSADAAAIAALLIVPLLIAGRGLVRRSRGDPFTRSELVTAIGGIAVGLAIVGLTRSPSIAVLLPAALGIFGALLVAQARAERASGSTIGLGYAALAVGLLGVILALVRAAIA